LHFSAAGRDENPLLAHYFIAAGNDKMGIELFGQQIRPESTIYRPAMNRPAAIAAAGLDHDMSRRAPQ
jgi:hypothetical protein